MTFSEDYLDKADRLRELLEYQLTEEVVDEALSLSLDELCNAVRARGVDPQALVHSLERGSDLPENAAVRGRERAKPLERIYSNVVEKSDRVLRWLIGDSPRVSFVAGGALAHLEGESPEIELLPAVELSLIERFDSEVLAKSIPWAGSKLSLILAAPDEKRNVVVAHVEVGANSASGGRLLLTLKDNVGNRAYAELTKEQSSALFLGEELEGDWTGFTVEASIGRSL